MTQPQGEKVKRSETVAVIRNWMVCKGEPERMTPPESRRPVLRGLVFGHEVYDDGSWVTTSSVKGRVGNRLLVASGRLYELGDPDPAYEQRFPDARERLLAARDCVALMGSPELHLEDQAA
jgi:hypothetical protein